MSRKEEILKKLRESGKIKEHDYNSKIEELKKNTDKGVIEIKKTMINVPDQELIKMKCLIL
jgi:hypothetical protein